MTYAERKEKWFLLLDEWQASGLTAEQYKDQKQITDSSFYRWLKRYQAEKSAAARTDESQEGKKAVRFVEAVAPKMLSIFSDTMNLSHASGWTLSLPQACSATWLSELLRGLSCN